DDDLRMPRPVSRVNRAAVCALLVLLLVPLAIEAISLCVGQWYSVLDRPFLVRTPVLDFSLTKLEAGWQEIASWGGVQFDEATRSPMHVLPVIVVILVIAMRLLKK